MIVTHPVGAALARSTRSVTWGVAPLNHSLFQQCMTHSGQASRIVVAYTFTLRAHVVRRPPFALIQSGGPVGCPALQRMVMSLARSSDGQARRPLEIGPGSSE